MYTRNWEALHRPDMLDYNRDTATNDYTQFIVQPLERGFGTTVGHSLRRVLLSVMQGCAPVAAKIEGVQHEFGTIPGIKEDVIQILLNVKKLQLKQLEEGIHEIEIVGSGPTTLYAKHFVSGGKVEILNPDQPIATLEEGATLEMVVYIGMNHGYVLAEENSRLNLPEQVIYLDSVHSPIKRVKYEVQNARVEQRTDFDKLIFDVWTNGSIAPSEAVAYAAKIMEKHMGIFINFDEEEVAVDEREKKNKAEVNHNLSRSISELELSVRSINCLQNAKIETIGQLVERTEQDMLKAKNFGKKSLDEIKRVLSKMNLTLGMTEEQLYG